MVVCSLHTLPTYNVCNFSALTPPTLHTLSDCGTHNTRCPQGYSIQAAAHWPVGSVPWALYHSGHGLCTLSLTIHYALSVLYTLCTQCSFRMKCATHSAKVAHSVLYALCALLTLCQVSQSVYTLQNSVYFLCSAHSVLCKLCAPDLLHTLYLVHTLSIPHTLYELHTLCFMHSAHTVHYTISLSGTRCKLGVPSVHCPLCALPALCSAHSVLCRLCALYTLHPLYSLPPGL